MVYPKKVHFRNYVFVVDEQVYEPAEDTLLISEHLTVEEGDIVLDMGTGCGILAVLAAEKSRKVVAVDINPYAVECATKNAEIHGFKEKIEFQCGDLFQPIKPDQRFNLIIFNAPYLPSEPGEEASWIGKAWAGGQNGREVIDRFVANSRNYLGEGGRIQLVQSSLSDVNRTLEMFNSIKIEAGVVAKVKVPYENIVLIETKRQREA